MKDWVKRIRNMTNKEKQQHQDARVLAALWIADPPTTTNIADSAGSEEFGFVTVDQARASLKRLSEMGLVEEGDRIRVGRKSAPTWHISFFTEVFYKEIT